MKIDIYIEDLHYGCRFWDVAPRINDSIKLEGEKSGVYQVTDAIWCGQNEPQVILTVSKT